MAAPHRCTGSGISNAGEVDPLLLPATGSSTLAPSGPSGPTKRILMLYSNHSECFGDEQRYRGVATSGSRNSPVLSSSVHGIVGLVLHYG